MGRVQQALLLIATATLIIAPMGLADTVEVNPVVNPGFESDLPTLGPLEGTPADECIGIGHQVFYGTDSPQHKLIDEQDPQGAAEQVQEDPEGEAVFLTGYGHCVYGSDTGSDAAWLNPVRLAGDDAVHWSGHDDDNVTDVDQDGDREIHIPENPSSRHNFWQAWPSPFQAFTGNFEALEFDLEQGSIPDNALVQVSLSATPTHTQTADLVLYRDCALNFRGDLLNDHLGPNGHVYVDPVDAGFSHTGDEHCKDLADAWQDADDTERREILGQLRVVQLSFWAFETPKGPSGPGTALDDISLTDATTVAEEAANGNVNVDPSPPSADDI